ncbi:bifunctional tRNA (5-methylaminomethyl-2-thiouridine)(34)-methyltransferase MnmD/FAD-dependent 5-carboxymethylaminomethyl-2-thiouridine(34) oxidoreductase MnmC [Aestuariibacter salexigens]|uniref:bifunctional tRNA (5-methylaminomethyl-2-thiouridine)(34)-methyltransferase MnmD/FAD-dependent 5-carboxymethylaminomethyl-2-thiouridine(34) oxidoreductase MnmC n=1 Tax=Aestuariibacter salexigens TaxID=226010 RepID=UPI00146FB066|nr:bifunctional tRNA (5-methylaminomethyl-2-thiouridine)(34)-methyltransferase MnmD/FAD-dependent 5-carboxymethylaminomethyl-2-thiouridine(34) oxidoreductase MnmC [Aestuariibacter salexigens]
MSSVSCITLRSKIISYLFTVNLRPAQIHFNQQGTPVSDEFDDVYFSNANGIEETQYVFLNNNDLPARWLQCQAKNFVIAETGFGTGLNFLVTLQAYLHHPTVDDLPRLHFISVEKFPIEREVLAQALANWPTLEHEASQLIAQYPLPIAGCHRLSFANGKVILDLHFGDAIAIFENMQAPQNGLIDCWYLDGFAPSKNPQMWQPELFAQMRRLTKSGGTFATFTAAGVVKRGLRDAGFTIEKRPGFGRKRDMLAGTLPAEQDSNGAEPTHFAYYQRLFDYPQPANTTIVGAGLAGACIAYLLTQQGIPITLISQGQDVADGASGNLVGGFYPQLHAQFSPMSQCQALSFLHARRFYDHLEQRGISFEYDWCGVLQLAHTDTLHDRLHKISTSGLWPAELACIVDRSRASQLAGVQLEQAALHIPMGGWISPASLVRALVDAAVATGLCELQLGQTVTYIQKEGDLWRLQTAEGNKTHADAVVLTTGAQSAEIMHLDGLPMRPVRGQVEHVPAQPSLAPLKSVLCHKGYFTPAVNGMHAMGSTYVKGSMNTDVSAQETQVNMTTHHAAMQGNEWFDNVDINGEARASVRNTVPDHQPIVGAVPDLHSQTSQYAELYKARSQHTYPLADNKTGMYVCTGLGSRGLTTAPLMAQLTISQMLGQPLPLTAPLLDALNPNRFLIKALRKMQQG